MKCEFCGKEFEANRPTRKFCSRECYGKNRSLNQRKLKNTVEAKRQREKAEIRRKIKNKKPIGLLKTCATCKYCKKVGVPDMWDCWHCTHKESMYYGSLLNIDLNGNAFKKVTWLGCKKWKLDKDQRRVKRKADANMYKAYVREIIKGDQYDRGAEKS